MYPTFSEGFPSLGKPVLESPGSTLGREKEGRADEDGHSQSLASLELHDP
jgi:hypothetical protein